MKALSNDLKREIRRTWSRFISIMVIIALGVGFFVGVKATSPSMIKTANSYFNDTQLMDIRLLSTFGFDDSDVQAIKAISGVEKVMPSYSVDVILKDDDQSSVVKMIGLPEEDSQYDTLNKPTLVEGRMPEAANECLAEIPINSGLDYQIGEKITVSLDLDDTSLEDVLKEDTYTIVGIVDSSMYITYDRGVSSIGDGSISNYFMIPDENFLYSRYTELYIKTTNSDVASTFSSEYKNEIADLTTAFDAMSFERYALFKEDMTVQISEAEQELAQKESDAQTQLSEAKTKLEQGLQQLASAKEELAKKQKEYEAGVANSGAAKKQLEAYRQKIYESAKQLEAAKADYKAGVAEYNTNTTAGKQELDAGWNEYNQGVIALNEHINEYNEGRRQVDQLNIEYQNGANQYNAGVEQLNTRKQDLEKGKDDIESAKQSRDYLQYYINLQKQNGASEEDLASSREQLAQLDQQIADGEKQIADGEVQIAAAEEQLAASKIQLDTLKQIIDEKEAELASGQAQINDKIAVLNAGKQELDTQQAVYDSETAAGKQRLDDAYAVITQGDQDIKNGRIQLADGQAQLDALAQGKSALEEGNAIVASKSIELEEGQRTYDASVMDTDLQIKDGAERISNAKDLISDVQPGKWYVFTRDDNPGYSGFEDDANRIDAIASIFPVFFLLVAALVCLTTMTRMVEEQRVQIGTLKALGYGPKAIAGKYFIYASLASLIGSVIGIVLGVLILPKVIFGAYKAMYTMPTLQYSVPISVIIIAIIAALICTSTVALVSCYKELKIQPAALMRPKAPKPGKRIFMERIGFLWNHMQFTSKVTARNLFRYKGRFLMTVLGVAGCTALILAGLGLKDAISDIVPKQFNSIANYDSMITLKQSESLEEQQDISDMLDKDANVENYMISKQASITAFSDGSATDVESYLLVPQDSNQLNEFIKLKARDGSETYALNNKGVIVTEKLANMLNLKVGDSIQFTYNDKDYKANIAAVTENYVFHYIYCSPDYFEELTGETLTYNTILTQLKELSSNAQSSLSSTWLENDKIIAVTFVSTIVSDFNDTIKSLNAVVFVMILCAGALAFVVLYNLTNINIAERIREIATIKVLGFYNREVSNYVYRENIALSIIGIIFGLIVGVFLTKFMVSTIEMDIVMFGRKIKIISFLLATALTILFTVFVNWMMSFRMKKISMVESLKSIE